jgi:NAD(P)-dependent dehydrogenase (short-subunit alcohol dehydrogenase family)
MTSERLRDQTVVVFGAAGALGSAVVERLHAEGARVVLAERRPPDERTDDLTYVTVDALDESAVAAVFAEVSPSGVVNLIGGYAPGQPLRELDVATLRRQFELNLLTAANVTKYALPALAANGGGSLVHTSSRAAMRTGDNEFAYSVSKLAVVRLVEAAAAEARADGVRVNCILPSVIDTPANRAAMPNARHDRWPQPSEIAGVIAFLVSDEARLISGAAIPVYGLS